MAFTYFFRDMQTLETAVEYLVPHSMGRQSVRIWNAGCAMGPETYSLAILLAEAMGSFSYRNVRIDATDLDGSDLFDGIIKAAIYPYEQIQRIPSPIREKYFIEFPEAGYYQVVENVRSRVSFRKHDLLGLQAIGSGFGMIMCKNVLLHFSVEQRCQVIKMFYESLAPGGLLVMEQTQKLPAEMEHLFEQLRGNVQVFCKRPIQ